MTAKNDFNRLANETSPYLLQHADNPVHWYPWGQDALQRAQDEDKPILLSIGYSACHWCHVMAHESFEDPSVAEIMNSYFINIKVDREERPDIDRIYQSAQYVLNRRNGGWPLTIFLTPDQIPFFAGTYFPKHARYGLPGFPQILERLWSLYKDRREDIEKQNSELLGILSQLSELTPEATTLDNKVIDNARAELTHNYDATWGGFGVAPKFPHTTSLSRLMRHWATTQLRANEDKQALKMALHTLDYMAKGGIYDHLGGGFARYSVDDQWLIPHFEKMLYDNGSLLAIYAEAYAVTGHKKYRIVVEETADWVIREMQAPAGGYYSSLDADSEGEEGRYYTWEQADVENIIGHDNYPLFSARYGLDSSPNFEGKWHLFASKSIPQVAYENQIDETTTASRLETAREQLFSARQKRIRPHLDDKILTSWNALMIRGMAIAARHLGNRDYIKSAEHALDFIYETLWEQDRLLATSKDGRARLPAYLDDYAFLIDALLEMLQLRWSNRDAKFAASLADILLKHFEDKDNGGFYFTADDHENLIQRPKSIPDESMPSGYGVATHALIRLGHLLGKSDYLEAADRALAAASGSIIQAPSAHCSLINALEEQLHLPSLIILRGDKNELEPWHKRAMLPFAPVRVSFAIPSNIDGLPSILNSKTPHKNPVAYYCRGASCAPVITSYEDFLSTLQKEEPTVTE